MKFNIIAPDNLCVNIEEREENSVKYFDVMINAEEEVEFEQVKIEWYQPSIDMHAFWHCGAGKNKNLRVDWEYGIDSKSTVNAPVGTFLNVTGRNRYSVAYSDCIETVNLNLGVHEETAEIKCVLTLFREKSKKRKSYKETIRMDFRDIPYYEAIKDMSKWYETIGKYEALKVPEEARKPMYSTWYNYHQNLQDTVIEKQCEIAKRLGMDTIIVDDGWQTEDNNRWYGYTGDWEIAESRFPNMKDHVKRVHDMAMKYMIWYSVPYMGKYAKVWDEFKGKLLYYNEEHMAGVLDLRYPEVREYLLGKYVEMVKENDIDGLKLDFVDQFDMRYAQGHALKEDCNRDFESIQEAVDCFLQTVVTELKKIKEDIMIEFRQRYIGPAMRKHGNMFRVMDCPNDILTNRVGTIDLRLFSGNTAVHADVLMWNVEDHVESAALFLINTLFSVPQYSMKLDEISEEHFKMSKFYLEFMDKHRDVLLDGELVPYNPELLYPKVESFTEDKKVIAFYGDIVVNTGKVPRELFIVNGALKEDFVLDIEDEIKGNMKVYDCMGNVVRDESVEWHKGLMKISIPKSGIIKIFQDK